MTSSFKPFCNQEPISRSFHVALKSVTAFEQVWLFLEHEIDQSLLLKIDELLQIKPEVHSDWSISRNLVLKIAKLVQTP